MTYLRRAVKYFFYYIIILALILTALSLTHMVEGGIETMFRNGWKSVAEVLALFAVVAAIYPRFGFTRREALLPADDSVTEGIKEVMTGRGYRLEREGEGEMSFRLRNGLNRVSRMMEDRITLTRSEGGWSLEGLTRDVVRLVGALEYHFRNTVDNN